MITYHNIAISAVAVHTFGNHEHYIISAIRDTCSVLLVELPIGHSANHLHVELLAISYSTT